MKKNQQNADAPKASKSSRGSKANVNTLLPPCNKEMLNPNKIDENVCDEDSTLSTVASVSLVSTASQTSTPPHLPVDENLNVSLNVSERASDLVDKLMKIVDEELEQDSCKNIDALACVLLHPSGETSFSENAANSLEVDSTTSVHCQTNAEVNTCIEKDPNSGILSSSSVLSKPNDISLIPDIDESWLQKLDSIDEPHRSAPETSVANSTKDVENEVFKVVTQQVPRANMSVTVSNPAKSVTSTDTVIMASKLKHVSHESSLPDAEVCADKNGVLKSNTSKKSTKQTLSKRNVFSNISSKNDRTTPSQEQRLHYTGKSCMRRHGRHKKGCSANHFGPCQLMNKIESCPKAASGAIHASLKESDSSTASLSIAGVVLRDDSNSMALSNALATNSHNSVENDPILESECINASLEGMSDSEGQFFSKKSLDSTSSDRFGGSTNTGCGNEADFSPESNKEGKKYENKDTCAENFEAVSGMMHLVEKTETSHEGNSEIPGKNVVSQMAVSEENKHFITNKSITIQLDPSNSEMSAKSGKHSKLKPKKGLLDAVPVPSSYPSLGPGPPPVPHTGRKYVGAHISAAGGIHNVFNNAHAINAKSFAMFMRSQRQWAAKPFLEECVDLFKQLGKDYPKHLILPHGSYLMNVGSSKPDLLEKSRALLVEELDRCLQLGIPHFNFHPGSSVGGSSREACCRTIAESINIAHAKVPKVIVVLENMCKQGNTIGGDFHELRLIIEHVEDRSRIGVCIDTCHAHNAGYDLATEEGFNLLIEDFKKIIGFQFLRGLHINDSKNEAGAHVDRHECIGKGHIGMAGMRRVMNCELFNDLPLILETPYTDDAGYAKEIRMLEGMIHGMGKGEHEDVGFVETEEKQSRAEKKKKEQKKNEVPPKKDVASRKGKSELGNSDMNKAGATENGSGKKSSAVNKNVRKKRQRSEIASESSKNEEGDTKPKRKKYGRSSTCN